MSTVLMTTAVWGLILVAIGVLGVVYLAEDVEVFAGVFLSGAALVSIALVMVILEALTGTAA